MQLEESKQRSQSKQVASVATKLSSSVDPFSLAGASSSASSTIPPAVRRTAPSSMNSKSSVGSNSGTSKNQNSSTGKAVVRQKLLTSLPNTQPTTSTSSSEKDLFDEPTAPSSRKSPKIETEKAIKRGPLRSIKNGLGGVLRRILRVFD